MGRRRGPFATYNPWVAIAFNLCFCLTAVTAAIGFVVLPIANRSRTEPIWSAICSAFGLRPTGSAPSTRPPARYASTVMWTPSAIATAANGDPRHGAFVALNCAACHGDRGINASGFIPNLAGMRAEVIVKQLLDYGSGHRQWPVMNGIGQTLSRADVVDVAAYYAALPDNQPAAALRVVTLDAATTPSAAALHLVVIGDPARGIAPCGSCHGLSGLKRAAPVLAGQQASYLERQLNAFQMRDRANDEGEQMRVIAAKLTPQEIKDVAAYLSATWP